MAFRIWFKFMQALLYKVIQPLSSTFFMVTGITFLATFFPIYIDNLGYSKEFIGFISSSYYCGMVVGAFKIEGMICRIGHIRAFSAFLSSVIMAVVFPVLYSHSLIWILSRFITGFCLAGLYIVLESWFLSIGDVKTRGTYLSFYMSALGLGSALSPLLMTLGDIKTSTPFSIVVLFLAAAIIPLTTQKSPAPEISSHSALTLKKLLKISPIGVLGCAISGFCISSVQSFLPVILNVSKISTLHMSTVLTSLFLGNLVFQYPVGFLSDLCDRRYALALLCALVSLSSTIYYLSYLDDSWVSFMAVFCIGGGIFALYPAAISYACDGIEQEDIVKVTQGLLLFYGAGSVLGPVVSSLLMDFLGDLGLFLSIFSVCVIFFFVVVKRLITSKPKEPQYQHTILPRTTPVASELDPRTEEILDE